MHACASSANAPSRRSLGGRLSHPVRQPAHTLTSSVEPGLIACLRWQPGMVLRASALVKQRAARLDLLRLHRVSASICPASTPPPAGVHGLLDRQSIKRSSSRSNPPILSARPRRPRRPSVVPKRKALLSAPPLAIDLMCVPPFRPSVRPHLPSFIHSRVSVQSGKGPPWR